MMIMINELLLNSSNKHGRFLTSGKNWSTDREGKRAWGLDKSGTYKRK